jgi:hypothetical protein
MTETEHWSAEETQKAQDIWAEYQRQHNVVDKYGQVVGIDPQSGRVWFGTDLAKVTQAARASGVKSPLLCLRAGFGYYQRKGGRR